MKSEEIHDLINFLNQSPTAWHAVDALRKKFGEHDFQELKEEEEWKLQKGKRYYVTRNGSSICAFVVPTKSVNRVKILGSHTDSPGLKIKPNAEFHKQNMVMIGVEVYGGPLLTSWLNRDLGIAGRVFYHDSSKKIQEALIRLDDRPLVIPQLAIHLDREVNEKGLLLNKQEHLAALAALDPTLDDKTSYLLSIIKSKIKSSSLLGYDLFLYPLEKASLLGDKHQMIASYRIDSLASVHAATTALTNSSKPDSHAMKMAVFWDNEEVGSNSAQGASSPFFPQILERITLALNMGREEYLRLFQNSLCISIDLGHALNPNYVERHDPRHQPLLGKGIVLKSNASQRYITDGHTSAIIADLCEKNRIPLQKFVTRSDIPCGTTIGPLHANLTGMKTVDIGCAQLSMHSARELMACQDHLDMCHLLQAFLD